MRELHLVHSIKLARGPVSVFKEGSASWERAANGDYLVHPVEDAAHTYVVPPSGVKFERAVKATKSK